jgi:hypothetical protein
VIDRTRRVDAWLVGSYSGGSIVVVEHDDEQQVAALIPADRHPQPVQPHQRRGQRAGRPPELEASPVTVPLRSPTSVRADGRNDDQDLWARRFETHRSEMRAVAYRMLGSLSEADDAVQDGLAALPPDRRRRHREPGVHG